MIRSSLECLKNSLKACFIEKIFYSGNQAMGYPFSNRDGLLANATNAKWNIARNYFAFEVRILKKCLPKKYQKNTKNVFSVSPQWWNLF